MGSGFSRVRNSGLHAPLAFRYSVRARCRNSIGNVYLSPWRHAGRDTTWIRPRNGDGFRSRLVHRSESPNRIFYLSINPDVPSASESRSLAADRHLVRLGDLVKSRECGADLVFSSNDKYNYRP